MLGGMNLISVNVGLPRTLGNPAAIDPFEQEWTSAIVKEPAAGPVYLSLTNLAGDKQADLKNHGGYDKTVNAYPIEHYAYWQAELGIASIPHGGFGENFTTRGLVEDTVFIGDIYQVGSALVQVSQPRQPCWKLARRWQVKDLAARVIESGRTGWYFRVLQEGTVEAGNSLQRVERQQSTWTISAANNAMFVRKHDHAAARALANCATLSMAWREALLRRLAAADQ
jgi:MOSC domain-containing protein YiiM